MRPCLCLSTNPVVLLSTQQQSQSRAPHLRGGITRVIGKKAGTWREVAET